MENDLILRHVDHTLLKAVASWNDVRHLCEDALKYHTASVCVPPCYVKRIREAFPELTICTVIGFPLGYSPTAAKITEIITAINDGANELDMVINIADVKNGDFKNVSEEIAFIKKIVGTRLLKVIVETCYLTDDEKITLCRIVTDEGADYIKTSTGFGTGGAVMNDIELFKAHIGPNVKIKASGGIRTREDMVAYINAGCSRLGTSSAIDILVRSAAD